MALDPSTTRYRAGFVPATALEPHRVRAMSGVWDRDEAGAFIEELFAKHHGEIYAYLFRMMRDAELSADMTQDAFVNA